MYNYPSPNEFARNFECADPEAAIYASLSRVLISAPIENRLAVYGLMAKMAVADIAAIRQQFIDDLWFVADDVGLVALIGTTSVQAALAIAFDEGAL
jgi:hypothetical protein